MRVSAAQSPHKPNVAPASTLAISFLLLSCLFASAEFAIPALQKADLKPELKGQILIEELNCAACHAADRALASNSKKAPRLAGIGSRIHPDYLQAFIRAPHLTKPGTGMPDLLSNIRADERDSAAKSLTHFLLSRQKNQFTPVAPDQVAANQGEELFHSRGCVACHSPRDKEGNEILKEASVPLGAMDQKYAFRGLVDFLKRPHLVRPSGRMPDINLKGQEADQIAHYLLQDTQVPGHLSYTLYRGLVWEGLDSDNVSAQRSGHVKDFHLQSLGKVQHQTALRYKGWLRINTTGDYTFFARMNGGTLKIDDRNVITEAPSNRRGPKNLKSRIKLTAGLHELDLTYFHTGRDPEFTFEMAGPQFPRAPLTSSVLSVSKDPIPEFKPFTPNQELATKGKELFSKLGCASCHDDLGISSPQATAFSKLDPRKGCLNESNVEGPTFDFSKNQRQWISEALPTILDQGLDDQQKLNKALVTFNCIACHQRDGLGGIDTNRNIFFTGTHPEMGDQGRLPPPLTHVGAKLTPAWMRQVMLHGNRQRQYVNANMPQYGEANIAQLIDLFAKVDSLEMTSIPEPADQSEAKEIGHKMVGTTGLSCIACHDFNGQESAGVEALDLAYVTERIQKNWFHQYMRDPARFHTSVIMPSYWPGGQSVLPNILKGDSSRQIEALWTYLSDGTRAKKPIGLSRQSSEIRVADVAEIARGRGTAGYRGIGVGYPERINLAFDSEEMALRLLWKGEFVNINNGSFRARGGNRVSFPPGIPFYRLKSMDAHWPYKGKTDYTFPHDHGYQFRGYDLDDLRRPTFHYEYGEIQISDFFEDIKESNGSASFKRTFRFKTNADSLPFYFRAASGKSVQEQNGQTYQIDQLTIRINSKGFKALIRDGDPREVLIPITLQQGETTLVLEYQW